MVEAWLHDAFSSPGLPKLLEVVARTGTIYVFVLVALRMLGTRALGRLTVYDFVLLVVISNAVQNALVGGDNSLAAGLVSAATLLLINYGFSLVASRFPRIEKVLAGEPKVLVSDGRVRWDLLRQAGVTHEELMAALRERGHTDLTSVRLMVLEVDGTLSVVTQQSDVTRTRRLRTRRPNQS